MIVALYREFDAPMCDSVLFRWHESLLNGRRDLANLGGYRTGPNPMQVVSGPLHDPVGSASSSCANASALPGWGACYLRHNIHATRKWCVPRDVTARAVKAERKAFCQF
jgi:hypothetical protein